MSGNPLPVPGEKEGNTPSVFVMEEPMDCGESDDDLGAVEDDEATLLESVEVSGNNQPEVASSTTEPTKQCPKPDELAESSSIEDADDGRISAGTPTATEPGCLGNKRRRNLWVLPSCAMHSNDA